MLKCLKKLNKIQKISIIMLIFVLLCSFAGATGAWLTSESSVVNHFAGHEYYVDIELIEPDWDAVGNKQAAAMQPGMDIFKDPRVVNISEDECIVRMKLQILDNNGNEITGERYDKIINAIGTYNGAAVTTGINTRHFTEYNGWYYYTNGSDYCKQLTAGEPTAPLFTDVIIPNLKKDYKEYFDSGFSINVIAEAVFSLSNSYTARQAAARFEGTSTNNENTETAALNEYSLSGSALKAEKNTHVYVKRTESNAVFTADPMSSGSALETEVE